MTHLATGRQAGARGDAGRPGPARAGILRAPAGPRRSRTSWSASAPAGIAARRFDGTFTEAHILAITQAICDYRAAHGTDGPLYMGKDTHALSGPAQRTALEVLAGERRRDHHPAGRRRDADAGHLARHPRPQPRPQGASRGRHRRSRRRTTRRRTAASSTTRPNGGPADTDVTQWIEDRANELLRGGNAGVKRVPFAAALEGARPRTRKTSCCPTSRTCGTSSTWTAIRAAGLKLAVDPLGGAAAPLLGADQRRSTGSTSRS